LSVAYVRILSPIHRISRQPLLFLRDRLGSIVGISIKARVASSL
jgi:hypothetical protein